MRLNMTATIQNVNNPSIFWLKVHPEYVTTALEVQKAKKAQVQKMGGSEYQNPPIFLTQPTNNMKTEQFIQWFVGTA